MRFENFDVEERGKDNFKQLHDFMPDRCFRMLVCAPSGGGKTNLLLNMIYKLLYFDEIFLYAKNLQQQKYQHLLRKFEPLSKEVGYDVINASNGDILLLDEMTGDNQKLVIFDDYLNTGRKNDEEIRNYFTGSRNKNCSCIYLSQSYYGTDKTVRLNCSHFCVFDFPSRNERNMICRELGVDQDVYQKAVAQPFDFLYVDKIRKFHSKNFDENI